MATEPAIHEPWMYLVCCWVFIAVRCMLQEFADTECLASEGFNRCRTWCNRWRVSRAGRTGRWLVVGTIDIFCSCIGTFLPKHFTHLASLLFVLCYILSIRINWSTSCTCLIFLWQLYTIHSVLLWIGKDMSVYLRCSVHQQQKLSAVVFVTFSCHCQT